MTLSLYSLPRVELVYNVEDWRSRWAKSAHPRPSPPHTFIITTTLKALTSQNFAFKPRTLHRAPVSSITLRRVGQLPRHNNFAPSPTTRGEEPTTAVMDSLIELQPPAGSPRREDDSFRHPLRRPSYPKGASTHAVSVTDTFHSTAQVPSRKRKVIPRRQLSRRVLLAKHG